MNHAMMVNVRKVQITIGAEDALLLQGLLRLDHARFVDAGNEVMTDMLERVEEALQAANAPK